MSAPHSIRTAAVLGAGVMGAQIAAHFANAGVPVVLLDLTADVARDGLKRAAALRPDPFFTREAQSLVAIGGFDGDLDRLRTVDWIVEAVVERLDVKQQLLARVEAVRHPAAIVSSNTSGIPISALAEGRSHEFRRHLVGTHFFNPPRYLRLLEIVPTADTDPAVVAAVSAFADARLGKGVVVAKDTPNFIANHIGVYGLFRTLEAMAANGLTIEDVDAITGPAVGRPKSATFRTLDIAGLDVLGHVTKNMTERLANPAQRAQFAAPPLLHSMIERGWIGEKAGQGFYKRSGADILTLDPAAMTYRERRKPKLASLEAVRGIEDTGERIRALFLGRDNVGDFLRQTLGATLLYAADVTPDIACSIDDVDRAMRWGFGWELGPFEIWDAIGIRTVLEAMKPAAIPRLAADALQAGRHRFRDGALPPPGPGLQILRSAKERSQVIRRNGGASLVDLGDGVLAVELHSKMNAIGGDTIDMLSAGLQEAAANFEALVVSTDAADFSAGANLMLVLLEAQEGNWDEIDLMVRTLQRTTAALRYSPVPVVVAPGGLALGGGCEIVMHGDRAQAAAESYVGLVEVGVGLVPAGGGTKEMIARAARAVPPQADLLPSVQQAFEAIAFAKVSTSAADARRLGYLAEHDGISMNRDRLVQDAKHLALDRARAGYAPPVAAPIRVGGDAVSATLKLGVHLAWRAGRISDHDALVGRTLARMMGGGDLPHPTVVSEQHLLDLEREAFLKLCGEAKTLERIQHTLKTGKPLRN